MSQRPAPRISVQLLRDFRLTVDDDDVVLPSGSQRLVVLLALQRRVVGRAHAAAALWPAFATVRANANLRSALWRTGEACRALLDVSAHHVGLASVVEVDLQAVTGRVERMLAEGTPCDDLLTSDTRADLSWDLLPDWEDDDEWVLVEREQFHQLRLHALEAMSRRLATAGRYAEAVSCALAAVRAEPFRESARSALIAAFLAEGNRHDARRQFESYRGLLQVELGLEPTPQLRAMVAR